MNMNDLDDLGEEFMKNNGWVDKSPDGKSCQSCKNHITEGLTAEEIDFINISEMRLGKCLVATRYINQYVETSMFSYMNGCCNLWEPKIESAAP